MAIQPDMGRNMEDGWGEGGVGGRNFFQPLINIISIPFEIAKERAWIGKDGAVPMNE